MTLRIPIQCLLRGLCAFTNGPNRKDVTYISPLKIP